MRQLRRKEQPEADSEGRSGAGRVVTSIRGCGWPSHNFLVALALLLAELPWHTSGFAVPNTTSNQICTFDFECTLLGHKCLPSLYPHRYLLSTQKVCRCPAAGYGAPNCTTECGGGAANTCNTRGECIYATGQCKCEEGWIGEGCSYDCPTAGGVVCSNISTCTLNAAGTAAVCNCPSNRRGPACEVECIGGAAGPCSGHGQCQDDGQCLCDGSYRGQACNVPCPGLMGYADRIVCSDHGTCTLSAQCQCDAQWRGSDCSIRCPLKDGIPCAGRGVCSEKGNCSCFTGMRGESCELECAGGSQNPCNGHGACGSDAKCTCQPGWVGEACTLPCPGLGTESGVCSGHGTCRNVGEYSECLCFTNMQGIYQAFEGKDCGVPIYHPRKLVNQTLIDRGVVMRVSQTWPAILAPAFIVASIATFFIARVLDRLFAEQEIAEISATKTLEAGGTRAL